MSAPHRPTGRHHHSPHGHGVVIALAVLAITVLVGPLLPALTVAATVLLSPFVTPGTHRRDGRLSTGVTASGITATLPSARLP